MKSDYTPYNDLNILFEKHVKLLKESLGLNLIGYYLQGSLAIGDFDLTSDVDFIIVIKEQLGAKELTDISKIHNKIYEMNTRFAKRLEYSFITLEILKNKYSPFNRLSVNKDNPKLWYFDNGSKTIELNDHCNTLVTRWTLYNNGITVYGPPPSSIVPKISSKELRNEIKNTMLGWGRLILANPEETNNRFYQSYLVLNFSRMLHNLYIGKVDSKLNGINWAKANLDSKWIDLINYCWKQRQDTGISVKQPADQLRYRQTLEFLDYVIDKAKGFKL